jgi:hypothetical protein
LGYAAAHSESGTTPNRYADNPPFIDGITKGSGYPTIHLRWCIKKKTMVYGRYIELLNGVYKPKNNINHDYA